MAAVTEVGATLLSKCLDFCQALSSQGQVFNFSVAIGPDFTFSLDTRSKAAGLVTKKKASPSTLKRNARRRADFLQRKQNPSSVNSIEEVEAVPNALNCDRCDYKAVSEKGLGQHKRMKHKPSQLASTCDANTNSQNTPEKTRMSSSMTPLVELNSSSPAREENCRNCEGPFSPGHQCENVEESWTCGAYLEAGLEMCPTCHVKRPNLCDFFSHPV